MTKGEGRKSNLLPALILVISAVYLSNNSFPAIRFDRERINVWVMPGQIHVSGLYHYQNRFPFPKLVSMGLPFPVDVSHERPSTFSISEATEEGVELTQIRPRVTRGNVSFRLLFTPGEEKWVRVDYVQRAHVPAGRYILKTTRDWGRPLTEGVYVLHLGRRQSLIASNYPLDANYTFQRNDFYPSEDWIFKWTEKAGPILQVKGDK